MVLLAIRHLESALPVFKAHCEQRGTDQEEDDDEQQACIQQQHKQAFVECHWQMGRLWTRLYKEEGYQQQRPPHKRWVRGQAGSMPSDRRGRQARMPSVSSPSLPPSPPSSTSSSSSSPSAAEADTGPDYLPCAIKHLETAVLHASPELLLPSPDRYCCIHEEVSE